VHTSRIIVSRDTLAAFKTRCPSADRTSVALAIQHRRLLQAMRYLGKAGGISRCGFSMIKV
jgi:hypothetical protein